MTSGSLEAERTAINRGAAWATALLVGIEALCTETPRKINHQEKEKRLQVRKRSTFQKHFLDQLA